MEILINIIIWAALIGWAAVFLFFMGGFLYLYIKYG